MKEILFYPGRKKSLITILISILFSGLAIYLLYYGIPFSKEWFFSLIMFILFSLVSINILYITLIKPTPSLKLNENGIFAYKCPFIEWNNVRNIQIKKKGLIVFLCVFPYNVGKLMNAQKLNCIQKINLFATKAIFGTILVVRMDNLSVSQKDLVEQISEFKKNWADKYLRS